MFPAMREVSAACGRFFSVAPIAVVAIILVLAATTVWTGWIEPVGLVYHPFVELFAFILEICLLLSSYLATVLSGPGYVPWGWAPTEEELKRFGAPKEDLPLDCSPPARDCLQFCTRCNSYKPPRAHHCSVCGRCVLWMDHHCPWTNTCIGYGNLKSFVLFTHYVALACAHSFWVQSEVVGNMFLLLYRQNHGKKNFFWRFISKEVTIFGLISWIADLLIVILVGSLAWDMHTTLSGAATMVEEMIVEKAEMRRNFSTFDADAPSLPLANQPVQFPYDLGSKQNWRLVMGKSRWHWWFPLRFSSDAVWPELKEGTGHFDLPAEQLAQKAMKLSKSVVIPVAKGYKGNWNCCSTTACRLHYWCHLCCHYGCGTACSGPCCDELHLTVQPGDSIVVSHREEYWLMGRVLLSDSEGPDGPEGWVPSCCVDAKGARKFQVPLQRRLQGEWCTRAGPTVVLGPIVTVARRPSPYVLRKEGQVTTLLGCELEECDGASARWSSGDVWTRPEHAMRTGRHSADVDDEEEYVSEKAPEEKKEE